MNNILKPDCFSSFDLIEIDKIVSKPSKSVTLTSESLTIAEIIGVGRHNATVELSSEYSIYNRVKEAYKRMMQDAKNGVPVYGVNTGYGARASHVLTNGTEEERVEIASKMSEGIAHVDVSVGPVFEKEVTRAAMLIRVNMLLRGVSAVKIEDLEIYRHMLNAQITPVVNQYGGVGASGDLAHNSRVLSAARQLQGVRVWDPDGKIRDAKEVLTQYHIPALKLDPKAGLGLVNGDNFSTAVATLLAVDTLEAVILTVVSSAMVIEVLRGSDRSFHPLLAAVRPHQGQREVATLLRYLLHGSKLSYQEMQEHKRRPAGVKVQDAYSLRCLPQFLGVHFDRLKDVLNTIAVNANSVSDNPLWVAPEYATQDEEPWHWVSGGNFIAMYMVDAIDTLRKVMTQLTKLNDRHLARMVNPDENNGLPPNLSDEKSITQCIFKGVQIQAGMLEVYSSLLSIPVSTFFGVHEENNQDITAHSLTSGILGMENLRLTRYSLAQNFLAVTQAVDLRGGPDNLSPKTRHVYDFVRDKVKYIEKEKPLNNEIETIYQAIKDGSLINVVRKQVFEGI